MLAVSDGLGRLLGRAGADLLGGPVTALTDAAGAGALAAALASARDGQREGELRMDLRSAPFAAASAVAGPADSSDVVPVVAQWAVLHGSEALAVVCTPAVHPGSASDLRAAATAEAFARLSQEVVVVSDPDGTLVYASPAVSSLFGYELADVLTCDMWQFVHPDDQPAGQAEFLAVLASRAVRVSRLRVQAADGQWRTVEVSAVNLLEATVGGVVCTLRDVSAVVEADRALRASEARYRAIADTAEEGIWALAPDSTTLYANARMAAILGVPLEAAYDRDLLTELDPRAAVEVRARLAGRVARGPERYEISYAHPDGHERRLWISASTLRAADGTSEGSLAMVSDITDVRAAERELRDTAVLDSLTRLPNRVLLRDRLGHALSRAECTTSVLLLDLDDFKLVNDSRGHHVGDQLLVDVAARLRACVRPYDTVARFGGDEFVVVCEDSDSESARALAAELLSALAAPFDVAGSPVHVAASIGIALSHDDGCCDGSSGPEDEIQRPRPCGVSASDLLRYADTAMHAAKSAGRGRVRQFDRALAEEVEDRYELATELRAALADDALSVEYQPIVDLLTGAVIGLEALARWTHPRRGVVPPTTFVAVAERSGLAAHLDRWVMRRALADMSRLRAAGAVPGHAYVAVNLSARNLGDVSLDVDLLGWAEAAGVPADQICLEVTETALMRDAQAAVAQLARLRAQGFRVAVDDFGTGYSSLAYLRDLPITALKIDRSFIADVATSSDALAIVASILGLGRAVGVDVVAEGVETEEQALALAQVGCASGQGWLWSRALSPEDLAARARDRPPAALADRRRGVDGRRRPGTAGVEEEHGRSRLLELHAMGASHASIAAALNGEGFRAPKGFRWHARSVGRSITQLAYPSLAYEPGSRPPPRG